MKRTRLLVTATVLAAAAWAGRCRRRRRHRRATPSPTPSPAAAGNGHPRRCRDDTGQHRPVADDRTANAVAGGKVTVKVLANDTDDGLGSRGNPAPGDRDLRRDRGDRVTQDGTHTTLTVTTGPPTPAPPAVHLHPHRR